MSDEYAYEDDKHELDEEARGAEEESDCYMLEVPDSMSPPPFRMIELREGERLDRRERVAVPLLHYARGCDRQCQARACRSADICQQPPLKCRLRPYAEAYDWDHDLPNGPRRKMYDEIIRKHALGCYSGFHFVEEVKRFTPNLPAGAPDEDK